MPYSYACRDFPGMEDCPAVFTTETREELWRHAELHGREAHGENPSEWTEDDRKTIEAAIRET